MKAIKIASGVAISALAAAISAQAHAEGDTEFSWGAVGSMEAVFVYDFENEQKDVDLDEGDDFDSQTAGEAWGLEVTNTVTNGPFSANIVLTANDASGDMDTSDEGDFGIVIEDLVVTDGAISFGQVGSLIETHEYAYDMGDSQNIIGGTDTELDEGASVDAGIRYTMNGLQVQIEGQDDNEANTTRTDYGVAAAYAGTADALSYRAEAQFRASDEAPDSADAYVYVGAGVTYTADMFSVKAAYNTYVAPNTADGLPGAGNSEEKETFSEYGFEVEVTPMAALTAYVKGMDLDASSVNVDDSMILLFGAAYTIDTITVTGEYTFSVVNDDSEQNPADFSDIDLIDYMDNVFVEVAYADGAIGAYADATFYMDGDLTEDVGPQMGAGVSYTQDNGVKYAADYDFQDASDSANFSIMENQLKVGASYAF